jgi:hypothetical protein
VEPVGDHCPVRSGAGQGKDLAQQVLADPGLQDRDPGASARSRVFHSFSNVLVDRSSRLRRSRLRTFRSGSLLRLRLPRRTVATRRRTSSTTSWIPARQRGDATVPGHEVDHSSGLVEWGQRSRRGPHPVRALRIPADLERHCTVQTLALTAVSSATPSAADRSKRP